MKFSSKITRWYGHHKRDLPWRKTSDPYRIWLSEIILQQTRIDQGLAYYQRFLEAYPDVVSLASAEEQDVLKLWQGLGYYTRARNLHRTAKIVAEKYRGTFPQSWEEVINLPGIGSYTAAAILSIAFGKPYPVVDGNVYRLLTRLHAIDTPIDSGTGKRIVENKAHELLDRKDPGTYNQAVMEFGALYCKPVNPDCPRCIFKSECHAFKKKEVEKFPVKKPRRNQRFRYFHYFLFTFRSNHSTKILINKRGGDDIWQNLYDFPLIETSRHTSLTRLKESGFNDLDLKNMSLNIMGNEYKHILSHQVILARFIRVDLSPDLLAGTQKKLRIEDLIPVELRDLSNFPIPRLIEKFLEENRLTISSW
jgi:A/G-specific adenine glycosylase